MDEKILISERYNNLNNNKYNANKKCPVAKLKFFLLFCLGIIVYTYYKTPLKNRVSINYFSHSSPVCNPKHELKTTSYSFSPKEFKALRIEITNVVKDINFDFKKTSSNDIKISTIIKTSDKKYDEAPKVNKSDKFIWSYKGPSFFINHGECASAQVTIEIPENLKAFESLQIIIPDGTISTNFNQLVFGELDIRMHSGKLDIKNQIANKITAAVHCGDISLENIKSTYTYLAASSGLIIVKKSDINELHANSLSGKALIEVGSTEYVSSSSINGDIKIHVTSIEANRESKIKVSGRTMNGDVSIMLPSTYLGRFFVKTVIGESTVKAHSNVHYTKNMKNWKSGFKGNKDLYTASIKAKALNGDVRLAFE